MSLLLLFHGAATPAVFTGKNEYYSQWSIGQIGHVVGYGRTAGLTAAVLSTMWAPAMPPREPTFVVNYGFQNSVHIYSPARRAPDLGFIAWPAQEPTVAVVQQPFGWQVDFS